MAIRTRNAMYKEYVKILELKENHFLDFKSIEDKPAEVTVTISAFANADGGEVYLGIKEKTIKGTERQEKRGFWEGFGKPEDANNFIATIDRLFSFEERCCYEFINHANQGLVLHIEVPRTKNLVKASDGKVYLRRNASDKRQDGEEVLQILYDKGVDSFEKQTLSSIALTEITNSEATLDFFTKQEIISEPLTWLKMNRLIREHLPTVGGILLFSDLPQAIIPKNCGIKIYRYKTSDTEGLRESLAFDPITIEGNIYNQIKNAVEETKKVIESIPRLGDSELEKVYYPIETLHEIIANAVLHRDYSIADDIHIRIFDNRVEVTSPGRLPGHVTVENILRERCSRNGNLIRIINKFPNPPNKDIGEGLTTAFNAMNMLGLKPPRIEQRDHSVIVFIRHEPLASCEQIILEYLSEFEHITVSTIKRKCHFRSEHEYRKTIKGLVKRSLIERMPNTNGKNTSYRKVRLSVVTEM
jgi:ATP-dependent DNA helicase RecG